MFEKPIQENPQSESDPKLKPKSSLGTWLKGAVAATTIFGAQAKEKEIEASILNTVVPQTTQFEQEEKISWDFEVYHTFFKKTEDGEIKFNPWAILSPFEFVASREKVLEQIDSITIPYEYSRMFDHAKAQDPEAREKIEKFVEQKLVEMFGEKIRNFGFVMTDGVLETKRDLRNDTFDIEHISVTGFASPEAKTPASLQYADQSNVELAEKRAEDALTFMPDSVPKDVIENAQIAGIEKQFDQLDAEKLVELNRAYLIATSASKPQDVTFESLFEMVKDFNDGSLKEKLKDTPETYEAINAELHDIIASKRSAEITLKGKNNQVETYILPIPLGLLLLLLPSLIKRLWNNRRQQEPDITPDVFVEEPAEIIPQPLPFPVSPDNQYSGEYWLGRFNALEEIYNNFNGQIVNYRNMCRRLDVNFERFATPEDRITWLSHNILEMWMNYDAQAMNQVPAQLNYKNNPDLLLKAKTCAEEILNIVIESRIHNSQISYHTILYRELVGSEQEITNAVIYPHN